MAMKLRLLQGRRARLDSPRALTRFLSDVILDLLAGRLEVETARTIGYLCSVQRGVVELAQRSEIEQRLAEVERLLAMRRLG